MTNKLHVIAQLLLFFLSLCCNINYVSANTTTKISDITISASSTIADTSPQNLLDNNPSTVWNAGKAAPAWVAVDLGKPYTVNQLDLRTNQSSTGRIIVTISGGLSLETLRPLITIDQFTSNKQVLTIPLLAPVSNIQYIKITTTHSPSWVSWSDVAIYSGTTSANTHLRYYGYMSHDGLVSDVGSNYFAEISALGNTNIAWSTSANSQRFADHGIITMITDQRWVFFDSGGNLNVNWQTKWNTLKTRLGTADHIYGFYFDEPVWRGYSKEAFLTATKTIKEAYPNKAIVVVEAEPPISNHSIPDGYYQYVTDIGFDYYYTKNGNDWQTYLDLFEKFRPYAAGKKIWLIPDGSGNYSSLWSDAYEKYLSIALTNQQVVGLMGFLYQWPIDNLTLRSALIPGESSYNQSFRTRQIDIGKNIISTTRNSKPGSFDDNNSFNIFDYNILVSNFGKTGSVGWIAADIVADGVINFFDYNMLLSQFQ